MQPKLLSKMNIPGNKCIRIPPPPLFTKKRDHFLHFNIICKNLLFDCFKCSYFVFYRKINTKLCSHFYLIESYYLFFFFTEHSKNILLWVKKKKKINEYSYFFFFKKINTKIYSHFYLIESHYLCFFFTEQSKNILLQVKKY